MKDLSTKYMGLELKNPLIAGSCGLTGDIKNIVELESKGVGAVVLKSLFEEEIIREMEANIKKMASMQFLYPETLDMFEHEVVNEKITDRYIKLVGDIKKQSAIPVIASINCITTGQWTIFPKKLESAGADGLELNIFVLPSDFSASPEKYQKIYFNIIEEVKSQVKIPLAVKISNYSSNLATLIQLLSRAEVDAIVMFNRFYSPDIDIDNLQLTSSNVLSSPSDMSLALRWMAIMNGHVDCDLAASTGVHDDKGLIKMLLAGANAVQVVSTLYKNGPSQIEKMLLGLEKWMDGKGYNSIADFRGIMARNKSDNPAAYERVQFMKYMRGFKPEISFSEDH